MCAGTRTQLTESGVEFKRVFRDGTGRAYSPWRAKEPSKWNPMFVTWAIKRMVMLLHDLEKKGLDLWSPWGL